MARVCSLMPSSGRCARRRSRARMDQSPTLSPNSVNYHIVRIQAIRVHGAFKNSACSADFPYPIAGEVEASQREEIEKKIEEYRNSAEHAEFSPAPRPTGARRSAPGQRRGTRCG